MDPKLLRFSRGLLAGVLVFTTVANARAQSQTAPRRGRVIQFSEPKSEAANTNLDQSASSQNGLRSLDADLKSPFQIFGAGNSLDGVLAPSMPRTPTPSLQSKKARELLEKKKNWWANSEAEMFGLKEKPEDLFKQPDYGIEGLDKKDKTSVERYYETRDRAPGSTNSPSARSDARAFTLDGASDSSGRLTGRDQAASDPLASEPDSNSRKTEVKSDSASASSAFAARASEKTFAGFFGFAGGDAPDKPLEKDSAREARMNDFKQLFESHSTVPSAPFAGFNPVTAPSPAASPSLPSAFSTPSPVRDNFNAFSAPAPSPSPTFSGLPSL